MLLESVKRMLGPMCCGVAFWWEAGFKRGNAEHSSNYKKQSC